MKMKIDKWLIVISEYQLHKIYKDACVLMEKKSFGFSQLFIVM